MAWFSRRPHDASQGPSHEIKLRSYWLLIYIFFGGCCCCCSLCLSTYSVIIMFFSKPNTLARFCDNRSWCGIRWGQATVHTVCRWPLSAFERSHRNNITGHKPDSGFVLFQPHLVNCFTLERNIYSLIHEPETRNGVRGEDNENSEEERGFWSSENILDKRKHPFMKSN